ncbi:2900_t:CDS:2, partial [Entrophospora sp. SA101]
NGGYMLRDISKSHKILSIHAELQINVEDHSKNPYYHNVTKRDISTAPLVPLLPGHCVIGKFGDDALRKRFKRAKADLEYAKNLKIRIH